MLRKKIVRALICAGAALWVYLPESLECGFVFDDHLAVEQNGDVVGDRGWADVFKNDFWGRGMDSLESHKSYRPLVIGTFKMEFQLWNRTLSAPLMHATNVIIHAAVSAAVTLIGDQTQLQEGYIAGLLFALHPVHVEAVTGIVGRAELLCALFMTLAYSFLDGYTWTSLLSCVVFATISSLCKEIGVTFIGLCILFQLQKIFKHGLFWPVAYICAILLYGIAYVFFRQYLGGVSLSDSPLVRRTENPFHVLEGNMFKLLSWNVIMLKYGQLLVLPYSFSAEYSYNCIRMVESWSDSRLVWVLVFDIVFLALLSYIGYTTRKRFNLVMYLAWLVIPFVPASHVFVTLGTLVAERLLYIPSIGFCLLVAKACVNKTPLLLAVLCVYINLCKQRIPDWQTDKTLFESAAVVCPDSAKVHLQLGTIYIREGKAEKAKHHLDLAKSIHPDFCDLDYQYAMVELYEENVHQATELLVRGLRCLFISEKSFILLQKIWDNMEPNTPMLLQKAKVQEMIGNTKHALVIYKTLVTEQADVSILKLVHEKLDSFETTDDLLCEIGYLLGTSFENANGATWEQVRDSFKLCLQCRSSLPGAVSKLAEIYSKALATNPEDASLYLELGNVLLLAHSENLSSDPEMVRPYVQAAVQSFSSCLVAKPREERIELGCREGHKSAELALGKYKG